MICNLTSLKCKFDFPSLPLQSNSLTPDTTLYSRQCYFSDEKQLQFFNDYTKENCDFECLTNYTLHECGCVRFSMPRTKGTKICGIKKIDCCIRAEDELLGKDDGLLGIGEFDDCNCLPSCTSYSYGVEQSHNIIKSKSECSQCSSV